MLFAQLSQYLSDMESVTARLVITQKLATLFSELTADEIAVVPYLLQGRIDPAYTAEEFGMAEKSVVKAASLAFHLDPSSFARQVTRGGDLGIAIEQARTEFTSYEQEDLDILTVFDHLVNIAHAKGPGSQETKAQILALLFVKLDPLSNRFLARILVGRMRLGASDVTVLDALSWMIGGDKSLRPTFEKAYQVRPDLGYICQRVKAHGARGVEGVHPIVGTPILMMRAERLSSGNEIVEKLGECIVEPKYDGLRLQIHLQKSEVQSTKNRVQSTKYRVQSAESEHYEVKIFTRGLELVTHMYPDIVAAVQKELICENCIFEGEALGYDEKHDRFLPFQETIQRKRKHDVADAAERIPLRLMVFDILYLDHQSVTHTPLVERKKLLSQVIKGSNKVIHLSPIVTTGDADRIEELFDTYTRDGLEGIMAKKLDSHYKPGAREYSWVKLKRSYSDKVMDTLDCVVMGYDRGKGKRAAFGIGAVLVGVFSKSQDGYVTIAKIGTGMTDEEWRTLKANSEKRIAKGKPEEYSVTKEMECDVWVNPHIVLEIRADEITRSTLHTSGWSLRFPRLERFRDDKRPRDATTVDEVTRIASGGPSHGRSG